MPAATHPLSERDIQAAVIQMWRQIGRKDTLVAAIPNARAFGQPGLTRGLYDLLVIGGAVGVGFLELKTKNGKLSRDQRNFGELCETNQLYHAVAYGLDEALRILTDWRVLRLYRGEASIPSQQVAE